jgi:hypothetical protein
MDEIDSKRNELLRVFKQHLKLLLNSATLISESSQKTVVPEDYPSLEAVCMATFEILSFGFIGAFDLMSKSISE